MPESRSTVQQGLDLLASITTWKRAFITLALGAGVLFGALTWQHPEWVGSLVETFIERHASEKLAKKDVIETALPALRASLGARLVAVMLPNLTNNEARLVAYDVDPQWQAQAKLLERGRWAGPMPMFGESPTGTALLVQALSGEAGCSQVAANAPHPTAVAFDFAAVCMVGIPPGTDGFVGYVVAGFGEPITDYDLLRVKTVLRTQAASWVVY
jgi:hypothetical protein